MDITKIVKEYSMAVYVLAGIVIITCGLGWASHPINILYLSVSFIVGAFFGAVITAFIIEILNKKL